MVTLLLDTSTERGVVAIMDDLRILGQYELPFGHSHSHTLVAHIETLLNSLKLKASMLGAVVVGVGPGSYTGIRVGAIVGKTIAYTCRIPLIGVGTLASLIPKQDATFAAILDAKMSGVYLLRGKMEAGRTTFHSQPEICALENVPKLLHYTEVLVTPNAGILKPKLEGLNTGVKWVWEEKAPSVFHMAILAREAYARGQYSMDGQLDLLYMRKTQAEIEKEVKGL